MTASLMELKERSDQLTAQRKKEKDFRLFTPGEITELIVSHLRPLKTGNKQDVSRYIFQSIFKTHEVRVFDILKREFARLEFPFVIPPECGSCVVDEQLT